jgi:glyoxylase-like metal-dependent hydrolase (beta-lactamase superfamily II)
MNLTENSQQYTSNVYLVMGTWNTIDDINTLVDVGSDGMIIEKLENINTGLGKKKVAQVILTHSHSDHAALMQGIKKLYNSHVCAFNSHLKGIDRILRDGDRIRIGEQQFEVFHITAHSYDSICLYGEDEGILFSGDTTFPIEFENAVLENENQNVLKRLRTKKIKTVYPGHGPVYDYSKREFKLMKDKKEA